MSLPSVSSDLALPSTIIHRELAELLNKVIGLHIPVIGAVTLERCIKKRLKELDLESQRQYLRILQKDKEELNRLIEEVVIPETWFFRGPETFIVLGNLISQHFDRLAGRPIRILSIPCSSGEEPYSIVMTLLDSGWSNHGFHVDAVDISSRAIDKARRAVYTKNSFRNKDLVFRDKYFVQQEGTYVLDKEIVQKVHFVCGNVLDPASLENLGCYDIIFCRNILIYLDQEAQKRTVSVIEGLLSPRGFLFVGTAEAYIYLSRGFFPVDQRNCFVMSRDTGKKNSSIQQEAGQEPTEREKGRKKINLVEERKTPLLQVLPSIASSEVRLREARALADKGELEAAAKLCLETILKVGPCAEAHHLLGIIDGFNGNIDGAIMHMKKALYLQPDHQDSLILLLYMSKRKGDRKAVENYRRRLRRLERKNGNKS
jgi:chemotaxis protein methyltransferase WspC